MIQLIINMISPLHFIGNIGPDQEYTKAVSNAFWSLINETEGMDENS